MLRTKQLHTLLKFGCATLTHAHVDTHTQTHTLTHIHTHTHTYTQTVELHQLPHHAANHRCPPFLEAWEGRGGGGFLQGGVSACCMRAGRS